MVERPQIPVARPFEAQTTGIAGLWSLRWSAVPDERGSVQPVFVEGWLASSPFPDFVVRQLNLTRNRRGTIRGVHGELMSKLVTLVSGEVYAAIVDLRPDSATAGRVETFELTAGSGLFVSAGLGNAFQSTSDAESEYLYLFDREWRPDLPGRAANPLDPALGIKWPIAEGQIISEKDRSLPSLERALASSP